MDKRKFIKTSGSSSNVSYVHYLPFDEIDGLNKTEEELLNEGYLVDDIPDPDVVIGATPYMHYTPEKGVWYEYVPTPTEPTINTGETDLLLQLASAYTEGVESVEY